MPTTQVLTLSQIKNHSKNEDLVMIYNPLVKQNSNIAKEIPQVVSM